MWRKMAMKTAGNIRKLMKGNMEKQTRLTTSLQYSQTMWNFITLCKCANIHLAFHLGYIFIWMDRWRKNLCHQAIAAWYGCGGSVKTDKSRSSPSSRSWRTMEYIYISHIYIYIIYIYVYNIYIYMCIMTICETHIYIITVKYQTKYLPMEDFQVFTRG